MKRSCIFLALLLCLAVFLAPAAAEEQIPEESSGPVGAINPEPGSIHDLSKDGKNTAVSLVKAGTYYFTGKSSTTRIYITVANVTVVLKNDVRISLGAYADHGKRASPITVENMGGTVTIKSDAGATAYLAGYMAPAIRKSGTSTKLVMDTVDPSNKGRIICKGGDDSAGIGDVEYLSGTHWTGNITFQNGVVEATAGGSTESSSIKGGTAGIGGGRGCGLCNCYIKSGEVDAEGTGSGAGIGGGTYGEAKNIVISGGTVYAVAPTYGGGAAIGGGFEGDAKNITVSGGHIIAKGGGNGIGGGGNATGDGINIKGGRIEITNKNASGIGAGSGYYGNDGGLSNVHISGGYITIDVYTNAIGNHRANLSHHPLCTVKISGGTIEQLSKSIDYAIGRKNTDIVITGGNVYLRAKKGLFYSTPTDGNGTDVELTVLTLYGCTDAAAVTDMLSISNGKLSSLKYNTADMRTIDGKLYVYLGKDENVFCVKTEDGKCYLAHNNRETGIKRGEEGTLYLLPEIVLDCNSAEGGTKNGKGYCIQNNTALTLYQPAEGKAGMVLQGYQLYAGDILVNPDGTLRPNITDYTDSEGRWGRPYYDTRPITLYAIWTANKIRISFDKNAPVGASSSVSGTTAAADGQRGTSLTLPPCGFDLPGWKFRGWTVKPDPTGCVLFEDEHIFEDPVLYFGEDVTLYAQWEPLPYTLVFNAGDGSGSMEPQTLHWDQTESLSLNRFTKEGSHFLHWQGLALGGRTYADGAAVRNITTLDADGVPKAAELTAVWTDGSGVYITPTLNGVFISGLADGIVLRGEEFTVTGFTAENGYYYSDNVPPGSYTVDLGKERPAAAELTVPENDAATLRLSYITVDLSGDDTVSRAVIELPGGIAVTSEETGEGDPVKISAETKKGYTFVQWASLAVEPVWETTPYTAEQTVRPAGKTVLHAIGRPNEYTLRFDANGGEGTMDDQPMRFGESAPLSTCAFTKKNNTFAGWTLTPKWTGELYADGAEVADLEDRDGAVLTLYAQWSPGSYYIRFNQSGKPFVPEQKCFFGIPSVLTDCVEEESGWSFTGWNTEPDGSGREYAKNATVLDLAHEDGEYIDLWGQWKQWPLTVTGPKDVTVYVGRKATFSVRASGAGKLRYQWQIDRGSGFTNIRGATKASYTTSPTKLSNSGYKYRCTVKDDHVTVTSEAATLTVTEIPPTGDSSRPLLWLGLMLAAGFALVRMKRSRERV